MRNNPDRQARHAKPPFVGTGGKVEERVDEAQDPWIIIKEEAKRLREEEGSGFTYLRGALYEEWLWRTRLLTFGIDGQDALNLREIPGMRQAQTAEERSEQNLAHQRLLIWQTVAKAGLMIVIGEWVLAKVAAEYRQQPVPNIYDWLPGPPELSTKLFDILHHVWQEAAAEVLGYGMRQYPKDQGGEQATYLLAGLLSRRIKLTGNVGRSLRTALATLAGEPPTPHEYPSAVQKTQLQRELSGATHIAVDEGSPAGGISALRDRVVRIITEVGKDVVNRNATRRVSPTESVDETLDLRCGKKKEDPEQELGDDVALSLTPERSAEELPGIQLFQTQEAVRQDLEERIKRYGLTKKEAEVARLRFEGKETHEIAARMGTKEATVRVHERNIRQKARAAGE